MNLQQSVERISSGLEEASLAGPVSAATSLSSELKVRTAALHREIESLLGLPGVIRTRANYIRWLTYLFGYYEPLERNCLKFSDQGSDFLAPAKRSHNARIANDLSVLGINANLVPRAASAQLPDLPDFAHTLGAHYVLEGAGLGGRVIGREVLARIGNPIAGATSFFCPGGEAVGPAWKSFQAAMDDFGRARPQHFEDVIIGAQRTFCTMMAWFAPHCSSGGRLS